MGRHLGRQDGAGVEHGFVTDGHQLADERAVVVGEVDDRAVLHVGARADDDAIDVAAEHGLKPHAGFLGERHVPDHDCAAGHKSARVNRRRSVEIARQAVG